MDNKITKNRLSSFLSYEWILMVVIILVSIFVWEIAFRIGGVKLTKGQQFYLIIDQNVSNSTDKDVIAHTSIDGAYSYDVLSLTAEPISNDGYNLFDTRYSIGLCDAVISDVKGLGNDAQNQMNEVRALYLMDYYDAWSFDEAKKDAEEYLFKLLKDGYQDDKNNVYNYLKFDEYYDHAKISNLFLERMKKDNRFRSQDSKAEGIKQEELRIKKLCKDLCELDYLMKNHKDIFGSYTRYSQSLRQRPAAYKSQYDLHKKQNLETYQKEQLYYYVNLEKLTNGKYNVSHFFVNSNNTAEDLVLLMFDFKKEQPHLQFETLSFAMSLVRLCSNYLDNAFSA